MRLRSILIALTMLICSCLFLFSQGIAAVSSEILKALSDKIDRWDVEEAWSEVNGLLTKDPKDPKLLELASQSAFYRGDYQESLKMMKSALELEEKEKRKGFVLFLEGTIGATQPLKRYESPHFSISLDEKQDGILADYIIDGMEKTYRHMAEHYGFTPKEKIRVEVFPDTKAFYYASSLSARDIEVTGAVGITQFNKLMVLSPRALVHGYRWLDAISHEYMHYLIVRLTANKAPIWFHEGLAKYSETKWRSGSSYLSPLYETLLSRALAEGRLIKFEQMEPSLVKLETPDDVQLAYAQAASAIEFIVTKVGHQGLQEIMRQMATSDTGGASDSIRAVMGLEFNEFEKDWKDFLVSKNLKSVDGMNVRRMKVKGGLADEERLDLEEIKSMVARNRAHLGDQLKERGRVGAAVIEYRRALTENPNSVPILNKLSSVLIDMDRKKEAVELLIRARDFSPDHPTAYAYLGKIYLKQKELKSALESFEDSIQINPFNPDVHLGLAEAYETLGDKINGQKEREIAKKLRTQ
jgi:tetratricopeptide (TPR) repeat protein